MEFSKKSDWGNVWTNLTIDHDILVKASFEVVAKVGISLSQKTSKTVFQITTPPD